MILIIFVDTYPSYSSRRYITDDDDNHSWNKRGGNWNSFHSNYQNRGYTPVFSKRTNNYRSSSYFPLGTTRWNTFDRLNKVMPRSSFRGNIQSRSWLSSNVQPSTWRRDRSGDDSDDVNDNNPWRQSGTNMPYRYRNVLTWNYRQYRPYTRPTWNRYTRNNRWYKQPRGSKGNTFL